MKSLLNCNVYNNRAKHCLALLLLLYVLFPIHIKAQRNFNYFEKRYDFHNNFDRAKNVIPVDSGYIIAGITDDSVYLNNSHISINKISSTGNILLHKEYGYDSINNIFCEPGAFISFNNKYYSFTSYWVYTNDWVHESGMISCFDNNLDTLWTRKYGELAYPYDTSFISAQIKVTEDGNFICTGGRMPKGMASRIWLLKTDSLGNKLWERFYGEGAEYFQGRSIVQTADGGYVIGAAKFEIHSTGGYLDPLVIKTDSLGNEEWRYNPGNPNVDDNKVMVALAADGNIIAGTNYGTQQSGDNRWAVVKIMKITPDGTVLWNKNYLEPQYDNFLLNTTVLSNGNIIANGSYARFDTGPDIVSWILCIDSLGNQLWYKEYALLTGHNSFNDLYDVGETPDGGLIGVGKVSPNLPDTGTNDIWVMKMDSLGCLFPGCDTTVGISEITKNTENGFTLYPNPARNNLTIELNTETEKETIFTVYNMYGIKVKTFSMLPLAKTARINISKLPQGVYLGVLTAKGIPVGSKKFVIKR